MQERLVSVDKSLGSIAHIHCHSPTGVLSCTCTFSSPCPSHLCPHHDVSHNFHFHSRSHSSHFHSSSQCCRHHRPHHHSSPQLANMDWVSCHAHCQCWCSLDRTTHSTVCATCWWTSKSHRSSSGERVRCASFGAMRHRWVKSRRRDDRVDHCVSCPWTPPSSSCSVASGRTVGVWTMMTTWTMTMIFVVQLVFHDRRYSFHCYCHRSHWPIACSGGTVRFDRRGIGPFRGIRSVGTGGSTKFD